MVANHESSSMYNARAVARGFGAMYAARACTGAISFVVGVLLIRQLAKEDFALLNVFESLALTMVSFTALGVSAAVVRYVPELITRGRLRLVKRLLGVGLGVRVAAAVLGLVLLLAFWGGVTRAMHVPPSARGFLWFVALQVIFASVNDVVGKSYLVATMRQGSIQLYRVIGAAVRAVLWFAILRLTGSVAHLLGAVVISEAVQFALFARVAARPATRHQGGEEGEEVGLQYARIARYSGRFFLGSLGGALLDRAFDIVLLTFLVTQESVANYVFCTSLPMQLFLWLPGSMMAGALIPAVVGRYAGMEKAEGDEFLGKVFACSTKILLWLAFPIFVGGALLSKEITGHIYGEKYLAVHYLLAVSMLFTIPRLLNYGLDPVIQAKEASHVYLVRAGVSAAKIVLSVVLIPRLGIMGLAVAVGLSHLAMFVSGYLLVRRHVGLSIPWESLVRLLVNVGGMSLVVYCVRGFVHNVWGLAGAVLLGGFAYLGLSIVNRILSSEERRQISAALALRVIPL